MVLCQHFDDRNGLGESLILRSALIVSFKTAVAVESGPGLNMEEQDSWSHLRGMSLYVVWACDRCRAMVGYTTAKDWHHGAYLVSASLGLCYLCHWVLVASGCTINDATPPVYLKEEAGE